MDNPIIIWTIVGAIIGLVTLFLPIIIAFKRRHRNRRAIAVAAILGLWPIAMIWAFTDNVEPRTLPPRPPASDDPAQGR
jgi:uncharacterized membrane protein YqjE